jgi:hypothetical protein
MIGAGLYGGEQDPTQGGSGAQVWDCRMSAITPAFGVQLELDQPGPSTGHAYGFSGADATDRTGLGVIFNVPPGRVRVSARFQGDVVASTTVLVRAGGGVDVWLVPPPR